MKHTDKYEARLEFIEWCQKMAPFIGRAVAEAIVTQQVPVTELNQTDRQSMEGIEMSERAPSRRQRRTWTIPQKMEIVREARDSGVASAVAHAKGIAPNLLYRWMQDPMLSSGDIRERPSAVQSAEEIEAEIRRLEAEIDRLKIRLADLYLNREKDS